ncbi:MAG: hypothetical protein KDD75_15370, partial [Caldilineaceae bacterium]|nr:hypothetical protein [Caldilineaceae bacterium]
MAEQMSQAQLGFLVWGTRQSGKCYPSQNVSSKARCNPMVRAAHLIYTGGKDATRCMGQVKRRRAISQTRHNQERCLLSEENSAPTTTETPWQYVRSADFAAPSGTVQQTVRTGLTGFWESLRRRDGDDESVFEPIDNLHAL